MAKLFNILAASVGSGLVLGASIRFGEALGNRIQSDGAMSARDRPQPSAHPAGRRYANQMPEALLDRLDRLEEKMSLAISRSRTSGTDSVPAPEWEAVVAGVVARIERQQSDMDGIRQQVSRATHTLETVGEMANHLRSNLHKELSRGLDERLADVEARLHMRMETAHTETVDAMVNAVEIRVAPRIIRMESDIAGQTAAVSELRECALQSERSIQRLLGVLERVINPAQVDSTPPKRGGAAGAAPEQEPIPDPSRIVATSYAPEQEVAAVTGRGGEDAAAGSTTTVVSSSFAVFNPIS